MLDSLSHLLEFYVHWNLIKAEGAARIFKNLISNEYLKVLDISWNSIGNGSPSIAPSLCEFFQNNKSIVHLDISNNKLSFEESSEIAKSLNKNRTIYGIHYIGNFGYPFQ